MAKIATLADEFTLLTHTLDRSDTDFEARLEGLSGAMRRTVDSYLGLRMKLIVGGHSITVTAMDGFVDPGDIVTSVRLPLAALSNAEPGSVIVFYAGKAGSFVNFATDLGFGLGVLLDGVTLDDHLPGLRVESGVTGLPDMSQVNQAIGILIDRGHTPEDAHVELRRLARRAEITLGPAARRLIQATARAPAGRESARRDAVAGVEAALAVDRAAVRAVDVAQRRLDSAMADFDVHVHEAANYSGLEVMVGEVELATHARLLAVSAEARGRRALVAAVTVFGALWDLDTEVTVDEGSRFPVGVRTAGDVGLDAPFGIPLQRVDQSAAAAAVVAEATAIAMAADAQVAAETKASAIRAARTAENAVRAAAVTVARAAESARVEQETAVADAAAGVAAEAVRTAIGVRARAEEVAAAASVAAFSRPVLPRSPTDIAEASKVAEHAAEAAAVQARDTAQAAEVVVIMVAASAAAVAAAAVTLAAATAQHVRHTAAAVQAVADVAAREIAATTADAARAAAKAAALRQSAGQVSQIDYA